MELQIAIPANFAGWSAGEKGTTLTHQSAQASFRLSSGRVLLQIDVNPTVQDATSYADARLAEAESAFHGVTQQTHCKVKFVEVSPTPKTGGTGFGATPEGKKLTPSSTTTTKQIPCKYFSSEEGCKKGSECTSSMIGVRLRSLGGVTTADQLNTPRRIVG